MILPERVCRYRILFLLIIILRAGLVMRMWAESKVHAIKKMLILRTALRNVSTSWLWNSFGRLVQQTKDSPTRTDGLYELTDDGVAEEAHLAPLHALGQVLLLLHLEARVNEHLLKLLVCIIDQELFKSILLESLKTINIQYSKHIRFSVSCNLKTEISWRKFEPGLIKANCYA